MPGARPATSAGSARASIRDKKRDDVSVAGSTATVSDTIAGSTSTSTRQHDCLRCKDRPPICFRCNGDAWISCGRCRGEGEIRGDCWCAREVAGRTRHNPNCRKCFGTGVFSRRCGRCEGQGLWRCERCKGRGLFPCGACGRGQMPKAKRAGGGPGRAPDLLGDQPQEGLTVTRCHGAEESTVCKLWSERLASGGGWQPTALKVAGVWSVENPRRAWAYRRRRAQLQVELGRAPAELRGFHGSAPCNILSIAENGFDAGRRAGQAFGAGEYFAKDPCVSVGYCRGGSYMLVCQLCLGKESSTEENEDGDHIWAAACGYYVISSPEQVLPLYIVRFEDGRGSRPAPGEGELALKLAAPVYRSGVRDERLVDLTFSIAASEGVVASGQSVCLGARPAKWCDGDARGFCGDLFYDTSFRHGVGELPSERVQGKVVLLWRGGGCTFAEKEARARASGATAMLVIQGEEGEPICMTATRASPGSEPSLPAAMLSRQDGERLVGLMGLAALSLTTARPRGQRDVPPNRPCAMTAGATDALWIGYLHAHLSDERLAADVRSFLDRHLPPRARSDGGRQEDAVPEIRIVRGKFTQAKVVLVAPVSKEEVQALNSKAFVEGGVERTVTVDDAHGSPDQRCPRSIARYCRGSNLRFVDPCWCKHQELPTARASFTLDDVPLESAKGNDILSAFMGSAPFHDGQPTMTCIHAIHNPALERQHELYRRYLTEKNGEAPRQVELYHGTNMNILDTVYTHGLRPPSDTEPSERCPLSGGKGLRTTLCNNDCKFCTVQHKWDRCHMYGLGVYLGDIAQKSHRYVSEAADVGTGRRECKMVVCSVLLGDALQLEGHLRCCDAMHDMQSLRQLGAGALQKKVDLVSAFSGRKPVDQRDILFVKGLGAASRPGSSVFNSEYISFHPYQCLPRYEITYIV